MSEADTPLHCSFCDKAQKEVSALIAAKQEGCFICDECVDLCVDVILEKGYKLPRVGAFQRLLYKHFMMALETTAKEYGKSE